VKRLATIERDGTVQLEVPADIKPPSVDLRTKGDPCHGHSTTEQQIDSADIQELPPMQIVMLIVGTRGDVQPFIAIGRRLQVFVCFSLYFLLCMTVFAFVNSKLFGAFLL